MESSANGIIPAICKFCNTHIAYCSWYHQSTVNNLLCFAVYFYLKIKKHSSIATS